MITYRPFLNTDPPQIVRIWQSQAQLRGRAQSLTVKEFEDLVLSKPYFERPGLIVAVEDERPIGFAHAAFGPNADHSSTSNETGVICCVMVEPRTDGREILSELLRLSEQYLRDSGSNTIYAGGYAPNNPFYLGLYGGSRLPGILCEDESAIELFTSSGYIQQQTQVILHLDLDGFRVPIDRKLLMLRRKYETRAIFDPKAKNWWEACTLGYTDRAQFELLAKSDGYKWGEVTFWDMVPLSKGWSVRAAGLYDLQIEPGQRRLGLATFLVSEAIRHLQEQRIKLAEVQTSRDDAPSIGLFEKLGFRKIEEGKVLVKS